MAKRKKKGKKMKQPIKSHQTVAYTYFEETAKHFSMSHPDLSQALGYSRTAHNGWRREHLMPKVAQLACEGLKRRNGHKQEIFIKAAEAEVIIGEGSCKEIHPGLFVLEL